MRKLIAADLFCGAGGTSQGAEQSGAAEVRFALNHWQTAVDTHSANFPHAKHVNSRLDMVSPSEAERIDLLFASPECTHHSRARGAMPTSDQQRAGAWDVLKWIEHHRPSFVVIENVVEFREWGPVGANGRPLVSLKGQTFSAWAMAIRSLGYRVEDVELNAADHGAATSRNRLFVLCRKGNRAPLIPEPTHGKRAGGELPGMELLPWRAAAECVDWSIPCPSIFARKRPLADNTLLRLEAGVRRFVGPFVFGCGARDGQSPPKSLIDPLNTIVTKDAKCLAIPYQVVFRNNQHSAGIDEPVGTICTSGAHHGVAIPFVARAAHGAGSWGHAGGSLANPLGTMTTSKDFALSMPFVLATGSTGAPRGVDQPAPTIVTVDRTRLAIPWLSSFYGNETQSPANLPVPTITTKDRHSLCVALCRGPQDWPPPHSAAMAKLQATMRELGVADLLFRMFQNHELSLAQGFPWSYVFCGSKADITKQIGNSVSPPVAEAITRTLAG